MKKRFHNHNLIKFGDSFDHQMIAYTTTKHAIVAMDWQMVIDYGKFNIHINALCPS